MTGSPDELTPNAMREPGLPLDNIRHCKVGGICWFARSDGTQWYRDLGVITEKDEEEGLIIIQSLTTLAGCPEYYDSRSGKYNRVPMHPFGSPVKTNIETVRAHLKKLRDAGQSLELRYLGPEARKVVKRAS